MRLTHLKEQRNSVTLFSDMNATDEEIIAGGEMVASIIKKECRPYLEQKASDGQELYRGIGNLSAYNLAIIKNIREDRVPRDSNNIQNMFFIDLIAHKGCKANRNNSTFVTTSRGKAVHFGEPHIIFPIGEFSFTWGYQDMTEEINTVQVILNNYYARRIYHDAVEKMTAGQEKIERMLDAKHPDTWTEKTEEEKEEYRQAAIHMNIVPHYEAEKWYKEKASPSEQRTWDWPACKYWLDKLKDETNSTLAQAMNERGEIMIACKQYIALHEGFYSKHVLPLLKKSV
jgi:hypothetical protein